MTESCTTNSQTICIHRGLPCTGSYLYEASALTEDCHTDLCINSHPKGERKTEGFGLPPDICRMFWLAPDSRPADTSGQFWCAGWRQDGFGWLQKAFEWLLDLVGLEDTVQACVLRTIVMWIIYTVEQSVRGDLKQGHHCCCLAGQTEITV